MKVEELKDDTAMVSYIRTIVNNPLFRVLKDAFVSHAPETHYIGTRFPFNTLEEIAQPKTKPKPEKSPESSGRDPDLEE